MARRRPCRGAPQAFGRAHPLIDALLEARLSASAPGAVRLDTRDLGGAAAPIVQVCLLPDGSAVAGLVSSSRAPSLAPGGRLRTRVGSAAPSRSAHKLAEAFAWL